MSNPASQSTRLDVALAAVAKGMQLDLSTHFAKGAWLKFQPSQDPKDWRFYVLKEGKVNLLLKDKKLVSVEGPAVIGHVQLLQERACAVCPPYELLHAEVVENAIGTAVKVESLTLKASKPEEYATLCNELRQLSCAGGWDPYLELYKSASPKLPSGRGIFDAVQHPYEGGRKDRSLNMRGYDVRLRGHGSESWVTLMAQNAPANCLQLVCNGFFQPKVRLGNSDGDTTWVVTAARAPTLVGEFERPLPGLLELGSGSAGPIPIAATICVRADPLSDYYEDQVFVIEMAYAEYLKCCDEDPFMEPMMSALARHRALDWLRLLGSARHQKLRVAQLVLEEHKRVTSEHLSELRIPKALFNAYVGGEGEQATNQLRDLGREGMLKLDENSVEKHDYLRMTNVDTARLQVVLGSDGRKSKRKTPEVAGALATKK